MTDVYQTTRNKEKTVAELKTSIKALIDSDIDMIICEVCNVLSEISFPTCRETKNCKMNQF